MSNLNSPHRYNPSFIEGYVLNVDPVAFVCSVKTINGKILQDVKWLLPTGGFSETGMHVSPNVQDRVLISTALGYPLILGCIPRLGTYNGELHTITGASPAPDLGTDAVTSGATSPDASRPVDFVPGDFMYTARGGSLIAVLSSGLAVLKASTLSQIVLSKFEGLVRVVTRNYQRFSDASSRVSTNMKGRLYEWFGADWLFANNQQGNERYNEVYGDVAAGEVLRGFPAPGVTLPAVDTRVRKQWLKDAVGNSITIETLYQDGSVTFVVQNWNTNPTPAIVNSNTTRDTNNSRHTTITDGTNITQIIINPTSVVITSNDGGSNTSTVTINPTSISLDNNGKAKGIFNGSNTKVSFDGKASGTFTETSAIIDYNGTSTGTFNNTSAVIDYNGTSTGTFNASEASITSGGHFCTVNSAGIVLG